MSSTAATEQTQVITSRQVIRNATVQVIAKVVIAAMAMVSGIIVPRYLGPTKYGAFTFAFSYIMLIGSLADPGISTVAVREIASSATEKGNRIANDVASLRIIASILCCAAICVSATLMGYPKELLIPIYIASLSIVVTAIGQGTVGPILQARLRMEIQSAADIMQYAAWLVAAILLAVLRFGTVNTFIWSFVAATVLNTIVVLWLSRGIFRLRIAINVQYWKHTVIEAWPIAVAMLLTAIYFRIDTILLQRMTGNQTYVGYYGTAHKFVDQAMPIGFFFATSLYPMLSAYHQRGDKNVNHVFQRSLDVMTILGFTVATFGAIFARPIIATLFGSKFVDSAPALRVLSFTILIMFLNRVVGYNLYAMGKQRVYIVTGLVAVPLNIGANCMLIPHLNYVGCAIAKTLTEAVVLAMALGYTLHLMKFRPSIRVCVLCALAAAATIGAWTMLRSVPVPVQLAATLAVYLAVLFGTKAVSVDEVRSLLKKDSSEGVGTCT